jgi:hypothetical protein
VKYRVRNVRTGVLVHPEETYAEDAGEPRCEWVLECEGGDGSWYTSGFHVRTLVEVRDPRIFAEVFAIAREYSNGPEV